MSKQGRVFFNVFFATVAVGTGIYLSRGPWQMWREQKSKADQAQVQMHQAEKEREELTKQSSRLDSTAGKEDAARRAGFLKPGETKLDVGP